MWAARQIHIPISESSPHIFCGQAGCYPVPGGHEVHSIKVPLGPPHSLVFGLLLILKTTPETSTHLHRCLRYLRSRVLPVAIGFICHTPLDLSCSPALSRAGMMPPPKNDTNHSRRDEWELYRREISRLFILKDLKVADIARYMKQEHGFDKK